MTFGKTSRFTPKTALSADIRIKSLTLVKVVLLLDASYDKHIHGLGTRRAYLAQSARKYTHQRNVSPLRRIPINSRWVSDKRNSVRNFGNGE